MMKKFHINETQFVEILNPIPSYDNMFHLYEIMKEGEKKTILEGLIRSYAPEKVTEYLQNYFDGNLHARVATTNDVEIIIATMPNDERYENECVRIMDNLCGYKMATKEVHANGKEIRLYFEPKFQKSVNDEMNEHEMLIHVSPSYNREKILRMGFCPKFKNEIFNYNDRIYFYSTKSQPSAILSLALNVAYNKDSERNDHLFDFYMVDPRKINRDVKFHRDGMTASGIAYWTYDNVPSDCIVDIQRMRFNLENKKWEEV